MATRDTVLRLLRPPIGLLLVLAQGAASPAWGAEADLGRLFYTPEERRKLDHLRSLGGPEVSLEARPGLRLDGVVRHPDGRITTWINGQQAAPGRVQPGTSPGRARLITESGRSVPLQVGDSLPAGSPTPDPLLGDGQARRDPRRDPTPR